MEIEFPHSTECKVRGGHLVQISDADMQAFLMTSLSTMGYGASGGVALWIGLNDRQTEGRWVWDNGTPLQGYTHWAAGETSGTAQHTAEDCVVLQFTDQGLWHDKVCHIFLFKADFICQYDASAAPTTTTTSTTTSTTSTTTTTTTTPATTTTVNTCPDVECDVTCPQGYSGLYLKPNGCIACSCL
ncbi:collectin-10-like [Mya arenaria]|uniref:collectin-10-like n=1 Tax=Mya arenaria TaxID=6604 RepID=UPI0022E02A63|nr:collectin-10-like [Mya arenaria]